jgi:hypothetical protein
MSNLRTLYKNINIINILLTITLVLFVLYGLLPLLNADIEYTMPPLSEGPAETPDKSKVPSVTKTAFQSDYISITERNLFHPERKMPEPVREEIAVERPDFVLYGTMMIGDVKIAYMEDMNSPLSTPGRGKRQKAVSKGDRLSGYILDEVYQDRVLMVKEDDSIEVNIIDPSKPKSRSVGAVTTSTSGKASDKRKELKRQRKSPE